MKQKIGIYMGDFDPVNNAHMAFARDAINSNDMRKLFFLVEPNPKSKQGVKAVDHRINMVILAVKNYPKMGTIILKQPFPSFDELMKMLSKRFQNETIEIVMPDDLVAKRHSPTWLKQKGVSLNLAIGLSKYTHQEIDEQIKLIAKTTGNKINYSTFQSANPNTITNRLIKKLKSNEEPSELPGSVYQYIKDNDLYLSRPSA